MLLQEVDISQMDEYVTGINRGLHSTGWHGDTRGTATKDARRIAATRPMRR